MKELLWPSNADGRGRSSGFLAAIRPGLAVAALLASVAGTSANEPGPKAPAPETAREFYNDGTARLREAKWREAEASLQVAVRANLEPLQVAALYNLGHVRFAQGAEALKEIEKNGGNPAGRGAKAAAAGDGAIQKADAALAGYDVDAIVEAYLHGRGTRKELKAATEAVKKAMETYALVLARWQRASGDFKSSDELNPSQDARHNGEVVDQHIARLVDKLEQMKMACKSCSQQGDTLKKKMKELKDRMPEGEKKKCQNPGDEEEDEEGQPKEPPMGKEEGPSKDGKEIPISPEDAARLLEALRLDGNRKLPIGVKDTGKPKNFSGKQW